MLKYQPQEFEKKWQEKWKKDKVFSPDLDKAKKPYYALMMFPYPSAEGLHVGNMYAFTGVDIFARYMRMRGYDVFEPIGLDGFGIHSENYAIKIGKHPFELSKISEKRFYNQLTAIGNSFDWTRTVETYKPNYYRWTQWIFLQMYKNGLTYRKRSEVNWCPSCKTVLADEQVIAGKCERCSSLVTRSQLEQWFFRITKYADRLLKNLDKLDWSEKVKTAQRNWIGRSDGMLINFDKVEIYTTRPETADGATFIVLAPEHQKTRYLTTPEQKEKVEDYLSRSRNLTKEQRKENREKTGVFTGSYVTNPVTKKKIPVWISDYVLEEYGTGAIMGVPSADKRDKEFAQKYALPMGNTSFRANPEGEKKIHYHLRDWLISRQRYWGPPIPIIYCRKCWKIRSKNKEVSIKDLKEGVNYTTIDGEKYMIHAVAEKDLPVVLPYVKNFRPTGTGMSPLASDEKFYKVRCPSCGGEARRETDVSDTFLDSAWYFFRYTSAEDSTRAWKKDRVKKWLPVNTYIGGAEHSVLHLLYSRFLTMVFKDLGYFSHFEEPFSRFRAHGLIISEGAKMSKSKGNVVNPDDYIKEYGADTLRLYLMFLGPFDQGGDFRDEAISGPQNFLRKVWEMRERIKDQPLSAEEMRWMGKTIKKVSDDLPNLKFNTAIAALMEWLNFLMRKKFVATGEYRNLLLLLAPFAPHITEELWDSVLGEKKSIHLSNWPKSVDKIINEEIAIPVQVDGRVRAIIQVQRSKIKDQKEIQKKALKNERVRKYVEGKKYRVIYILGKILNFVTS